jgi:hypothetical protein
MLRGCFSLPCKLTQWLGPLDTALLVVRHAGFDITGAKVHYVYC